MGVRSSRECAQEPAPRKRKHRMPHSIRRRNEIRQRGFLLTARVVAQSQNGGLSLRCDRRWSAPCECSEAVRSTADRALPPSLSGRRRGARFSVPAGLSSPAWRVLENPRRTRADGRSAPPDVVHSLPVPSKSLYRSLAVLFAVNILNFYDRQVLGALLEPIRKEFHLSDTQLGALGTLPIVLYALVGLPLGRLADVGSRKKLLAAGVAVWASLTGLGGLVQSLSDAAGFAAGRVCGRSRLRAGGHQLDRRSVSGRSSGRARWRFSCSACRSAARSAMPSAVPRRKLGAGARRWW